MMERASNERSHVRFDGRDPAIGIALERQDRTARSSICSASRHSAHDLIYSAARGSNALRPAARAASVGTLMVIRCAALGSGSTSSLPSI